MPDYSIVEKISEMLIINLKFLLKDGAEQILLITFYLAACFIFAYSTNYEYKG
jgi:hypothetical protein